MVLNQLLQVLPMVYPNDIHVAMNYCKAHHFDGDTNLWNINNHWKNSTLTYWPKNLTRWLNTNKVSLNVSKTEIIIFKPKRKALDSNIKIKFSGKILYPTVLVKHLGLKTDSKLNWESNVNTIAANLNQANAMLYRVRDFVNASIFKSIYYILFESHINY